MWKQEGSRGSCSQNGQLLTWAVKQGLHKLARITEQRDKVHTLEALNGNGFISPCVL